MQVLDRIVYSATEPPQTECLWIKPVPGGVAFYIFDGYWRVLKVMKDEGTQSPDDDQPYNLDGVAATKLADLEDVSLSTLTDGQVLKYNGSTWENGNDETATPGPDSVGTDQIIDNSVMMRDLNDEVKDKLDHTYDDEDESLYIDGAKPEEE